MIHPYIHTLLLYLRNRASSKKRSMKQQHPRIPLLPPTMLLVVLNVLRGMYIAYPKCKFDIHPIPLSSIFINTTRSEMSEKLVIFLFFTVRFLKTASFAVGQSEIVNFSVQQSTMYFEHPVLQLKS